MAMALFLVKAHAWVSIESKDYYKDRNCQCCRPCDLSLGCRSWSEYSDKTFEKFGNLKERFFPVPFFGESFRHFPISAKVPGSAFCFVISIEVDKVTSLGQVTLRHNVLVSVSAVSMPAMFFNKVTSCLSKGEAVIKPSKFPLVFCAGKELRNCLLAPRSARVPRER